MTGQAQPAGLLQVRLEDRIDDNESGHRGCAYDSPPHTPEQASALVRALLNSPTAAVSAPGSWTYAIAFGQRTVTLAAIDAPDDAGSRAISTRG